MFKWIEEFLEGAKQGLKAGWNGLSWKEMQEQSKQDKPPEENIPEIPKSKMTDEEWWNFVPPTK